MKTGFLRIFSIGFIEVKRTIVDFLPSITNMNTNIPNIKYSCIYIYLQQNRKYTVDSHTCIQLLAVHVLQTVEEITKKKDLIDLIFGVIMPLSAISWRPVLVVEEARVPGENHQPWASNW